MNLMNSASINIKNIVNSVGVFSDNAIMNNNFGEHIGMNNQSCE
jgi:hypothetical protein